MSWQRAGTVTFTKGSAVVVGVTTNFTAFQQSDGMRKLGADQPLYEILAIADDTHLTLAAPYIGNAGDPGGTTYTVQAYEIIPLSGQRGSTSFVSQQFSYFTDLFNKILSNIVANDKVATLDKTATADNAGIVLQSADTDRWRWGSFGDDNFALFRKSGGVWTQVFTVDVGTGVFTFASGAITSATLPRNRARNGAMRLSRVNGTSNVDVNGTTTETIDEWKVTTSGGGVIRAAQVAGPTPGGSSAWEQLTVQTPDGSVAAGDNYRFEQSFSGREIADFKWGTAAAAQLTVQFACNISLAGTYCASARNAAGNRSRVAEFAISAGEAGTNVTKTVTFAGDTAGVWPTDDSNALIFCIDLGSGSNFQTTANTWSGGLYTRTANQFNFIGNAAAAYKISDVELIAGGTAPAYEVPDFFIEMLRAGDFTRMHAGYTGIETAVAPAAGIADVMGAATVRCAISAGNVTSLGSAPNRYRYCRLSGAVAFTQAASLVCPQGESFTGESGATFWAVSDGAGNVTIHGYTTPTRSNAREAIHAAPSDALAFSGMQVNGAMEVSQENGTNSITLTATGSLQVKQLIDGVLAHMRGTFIAAAQQVAAPAGMPAVKALKLTVATAQNALGTNDELSIVLPIEGVRASRLLMGTALAARQALGFWISAHRAGTYSGSIRNSAKNRSYPFSFTITAADTPQWVPLSKVRGVDNSIPGDTAGAWLNDTGVGQYVTICLAGGTSRLGAANAWAGADYSGVSGSTNGVAATTDVFYISNIISVPGVELPSSDRAPFIMRPFNVEAGEEHAARYYERWATSVSALICLGQAQNSVHIYGVVFHRAKRADPTVSFSNASDFGFEDAFARTNADAIDATPFNATRVQIHVQVNAGPFVSRNAYWICGTTGSGLINFDARLS